MNKKTIIIIAVVIMIGIIWAITRNINKQNTGNETVKIGVIEPLTGGAAAYGEVAKNGFSLAIDEINSSGGIGGKKIEVVYEDSKCTAKDALGAAQKLVNTDQVQYLLGAMCSGEVLAVLPLTESKPMIFIGEGSSPDITGKGKYFFRTWPSDSLSCKALADYLVPKYKKIAVITEKTDYSSALDKSFEENVLALGGQVVASETFSGDTKDFRAILSKIKDSNPDLLFINPQTGPVAALIAKQARDLGIQSQFTTFFFTGDEFVKANKDVNGTIVLDVPSLDLNRPTAIDFTNKYKEKFGVMNYPFVAGQTYDYVYLVKQAIEKVGSDPVKVKDYLNNMPAYKGIIGDFSFDQNGDVKGIGFSFKKVEGNTIVDLK